MTKQGLIKKIVEKLKDEPDGVLEAFLEYVKEKVEKERNGTTDD